MRYKKGEAWRFSFLALEKESLLAPLGSLIGIHAVSAACWICYFYSICRVWEGMANLNKLLYWMEKDWLWLKTKTWFWGSFRWHWLNAKLGRLPFWSLRNIKVTFTICRGGWKLAAVSWGNAFMYKGEQGLKTETCATQFSYWKLSYQLTLPTCYMALGPVELIVWLSTYLLSSLSNCQTISPVHLVWNEKIDNNYVLCTVCMWSIVKLDVSSSHLAMNWF